MNLKKSLAMVLVMMLVAMAFTGCGSKEPAAEPASSTETTTPSESETAAEATAQGVTDDTILIGNSAATSGAFAPIGLPFIHGIVAYLEYVNAGGGIDGRNSCLAALMSEEGL